MDVFGIANFTDAVKQTQNVYTVCVIYAHHSGLVNFSCLFLYVLQSSQWGSQNWNWNNCAVLLIQYCTLGGSAFSTWKIGLVNVEPNPPCYFPNFPIASGAAAWRTAPGSTCRPSGSSTPPWRGDLKEPVHANQFTIHDELHWFLIY